MHVKEGMHILGKRYREGMDLTECLERYPYFPKFTDFIFDQLAKEIRRRGCLERADLALIYMWKNLWRIDRGQDLPIKVETDEEKVRQTTMRIFAMSHDNRTDIVRVLRELKKLFRVTESQALKVSTAILSIVFPEKYGIFDYHVENALGIEGNDEEACTDAILKMREIAKKQERLTGRSWTPRMVDKALWTLDKFDGC